MLIEVRQNVVTKYFEAFCVNCNKTVLSVSSKSLISQYMNIPTWVDHECEKVPEMIWLEINITQRQRELLLATVNRALDSQDYYSDEDEEYLSGVRDKIRDAP